MIPKGMTSDMLQEVTLGSNTLSYNTDDLGGIGGQNSGSEVLVTSDVKTIEYPPLGINPDIVPQPIKGTADLSHIIDWSAYPECLKKWEQVEMASKFPSDLAKLMAKNDFMKKCVASSTSGASVISEPTEILTGTGTSTSQNIGTFLGSISGSAGAGAGAGSGAGATEEADKPKVKKPFPYWLIAVAVVGGYLIFRKK